MNDTPFQQAHEESALNCQVVAVLHIGIDLHRFNDAEMLVVIISADNASGLEDVHVLRIGGDIHLKAAAFVVFNIPEQRGKGVADRLKGDRQRIFLRRHAVNFNLHTTPPDTHWCERW